MAERSRGARAAGKKTARIPQLAARDVRPAPVVLVSGAEDYFAEEAIRGLREILVAEDPQLEVTELEASGYASGELMTYVSPSLFLEPRLVIVRGVEQCTDAFIDDAIGYLEQPVDGTTLCLRHRSGVRGKRLLDAIRGSEPGSAIEVVAAPLKPQELVEFVGGIVRDHRQRIVPQAAAQLVAAFQTDLAELASATRQLADLGRDVIDEQLVDSYFGGRVETTGFKIADAALAGRPRNALALSRHAFQTGLSPVPIVAAVASKLRTMAKVSGLTGTDAALAKQVGAAPWQIGQARRELRGWDDAQLARAIELVADTDHRVKGASRDAEFAVERMLRAIATRDL